MNEHQRHQVLVAVHNEAGGLLRRLGVHHSTKLDALAALMIELLLVLLLVSNDPNGPAADTGVSAEQSFAVFRFVFIEAAAIHDASQQFAHVVWLCGVGLKNSVQLFCRISRRLRLAAVKATLRRMSHLVY